LTHLPSLGDSHRLLPKCTLSLAAVRPSNTADRPAETEEGAEVPDWIDAERRLQKRDDVTDVTEDHDEDEHCESASIPGPNASMITITRARIHPIVASSSRDITDPRPGRENASSPFPCARSIEQSPRFGCCSY
jgi:hypothetical protein